MGIAGKPETPNHPNLIYRRVSQSLRWLKSIWGCEAGIESARSTPLRFLVSKILKIDKRDYIHRLGKLDASGQISHGRWEYESKGERSRKSEKDITSGRDLRPIMPFSRPKRTI